MKRLFLSLTTFFLLLLCLPFSACSHGIDYTKYVSEYRSEIYLAEENGYALTVFFTWREYPYYADGVCGQIENLVEIYMTAPDNTENYEIYFSAADGKVCGGDMSYDSVYARFFYSQSLEPLALPAVDFTIQTKKEQITLHATSVKTGNELSMPEIIENLAQEKLELFELLAQANSFKGELYVRLVYNEKCYYFVAIATNKGIQNCFLLDACTGAIMAERSSPGK